MTDPKQAVDAIQVDRGAGSRDPAEKRNPISDSSLNASGASDMIEQAQLQHASEPFNSSTASTSETSMDSSPAIEGSSAQIDSQRDSEPQNTDSVQRRPEPSESLAALLKLANSVDELKKSLLNLSERLDRMAEESAIFGLLYKAMGSACSMAGEFCEKVANNIRQRIIIAAGTKGFHFDRDEVKQPEQDSQIELKQKEAQTDKEEQSFELEEKPGLDRLRERLRKEKEKLLAESLADMGEQLEEESEEEEAQQEAYWQERDDREALVDRLEALIADLDDSQELHRYLHDSAFALDLTPEELLYRFEQQVKEKAA